MTRKKGKIKNKLWGKEVHRTIVMESARIYKRIIHVNLAKIYYLILKKISISMKHKKN